jgi:hypothetical protein
VGRRGGRLGEDVFDRWPVMRYARDVVIVGLGAACILAQLLLQFQGGSVSGEVLLAGVTLLTAQPFIKLGDRRADAEAAAAPGRHEAKAVP